VEEMKGQGFLKASESTASGSNQSVPDSETDLESSELCTELQPPSSVTTLFLRGLPSGCTQSRLLELFFPPNGSFDCLVVPWNSRQRRSCPYCFMNFVSPGAASAFLEFWNGRHLGWAKKPLDIRLARVQGLRALVERHLRCTEGYDVDFRPAVFDGVQRVSFAELAAHLGLR